MNPLHRKSVSNKADASRKFSTHSTKTKAANVRPNPMRGGIRL